MEWMVENDISFSMVYTKTDKLSKRELAKNLEHYQAALQEVWEELPPAFVTSSAKKQGLEEVLSFIENTNKLFSKS